MSALQQRAPSREDFAALLEESFRSAEISEGAVVKGTVVAIEKDVAVIDVGLKTEGRVALKEFAGPGRAKPPSRSATRSRSISSASRTRSARRSCRATRRAARRAGSSSRRRSRRTRSVNGVIFNQVKGGYTVDLDGAVAFLPRSQVDIRPVRDVDAADGRAAAVPDPQDGPPPRQHRRLAPHRARGEPRRAALRARGEPRGGPGHRRRGQEHHRVRRLRRSRRHRRPAARHRHGVAARQPPDRGRQHRPDRSRSRSSRSTTRRTASRSASSSSWPIRGRASRPAIRSNAKLKGRVTNITDYGAFVELEPGIEGLIHVSEMSWTKKNVHPGKIVSTSQEVEVQILEVDPVKRRISLGLKQTLQNPWEAFAEKHPVGSDVEGEVKNKTEFGLFIGLEGDVDGMVHLSDLDWNRPGEQVIEEFKKGDMVKAQVLDVDVEKERISLGIKQLAGDPFADAGEMQEGPGRHLRGARGEGLRPRGEDRRHRPVDLHPPRRARPRPRRPAPRALRRRREGRRPRDAVRPQGAQASRCRSRRSRSPRRRRRSPSTARPIPAPRSATSSAPRSTRRRPPRRSDAPPGASSAGAAKAASDPLHRATFGQDPGSPLRVRPG